jgi:AhpD family alkylhydroperoxidase
MARFPYKNTNDPAIAPLAEQIVQVRGEVLHLDRMLLHSPPVAEGWLKFMTAVRRQTKLAGALRELVILRIAILNDAPYKADQHKPTALKEGVRIEQIEALAEWESRSELFNDEERSALALTDQITRNIKATDGLWHSAMQHWDARELVELVITIASYNMVSRFLEAFQIRSVDA